MSFQIAKFAIANERDVAWAAQRARLLASLANIQPKRRTAFGKATTALATDIVREGGGGTVTFRVASGAERPAVEAEFRFDRVDAERAPAAEAADATEDTNGAGASVAADVQRWVDAFSESVEGQAVVRRIGLLLPTGSALPSETLRAEWRTVLKTRTVQSALATSQSRIQDLAERLEETQRQGVDLQKELSQVRSLNETLELLALVASKTDNAVIILDAAGLIEWVNDGFVRITGRELPEVQGTLLPEFFRGSAGKQHAADALQEAFASGRGVVREIQHARKSGETYWASLNVTPVFNEVGTITRWIGIANDVTERHRYEEELLRAKEIAESASRTKSQFLANVSHEIRTPMNAIIGMTELALDTDLSPEQDQYLRTVRQSAESLLALLNDLLDLSKIEAGRLAIDPIPLRLRETLDAILRPHALQAARQKLQFKRIVDSSVPTAVIADPMRLRQIVTNLVANALKFTERGEVEVYVTSQWSTEIEVGLQFHVRDTGIGIPADRLNDIFDSFTQAETATARHYGGTGLGLAICKELTELMGGRLWVESEVGRGSTFHFTLRMQLASEQQAQSVAAVIAPDLDTSPRRTLHILVADDNPANRMLAARILEKRGHRIQQAANGQDVLDAVRRTSFDVALLDIQMPDMDGFTCTKRIRESESGSPRHLPIVAVTAYAMQGDRERCLAVGMDNYISKPIRSDRLLALVESLAEGHTASDESQDETGLRDGPIGFSNALARLEGDVEIFREQITYFLNDSPALVDRVRDAIHAGDAHALHIAAHRLKGLCASFDAEEVVALAFELEQAGSKREFGGAATALDKLVRELDELRRALRKYLDASR